MSNRVSIVVEEIDDASIVAEFEQAIHDSFDDLALPGPWQVVVRPSRISGRWDFSVRGLDVRHSISIAIPPPLLPTLIPPRLTESLNRIVSRNIEAAAQRTMTFERTV
jgi:hypothetical protein